MTSPSDPAGHEGGRASALATIKDNLEAFAVAIVIALVIKHFCVEAFKIPTGSMRPTLLGDDDNPQGGDRILVDKWAYLFHGPERWDVVVFRYPLDKSRNFIKRVAGLPGERVRIRGGDIWVRGPGEDRWRIATKGARARQELLFSVYPARDPGPGDGIGVASKAWIADPPTPWRVESDRRLEFGGGASSDLVYQPRIRSRSSSRALFDEPGDSRLARDVRVRARVTAPEGSASVGFSWRAGEIVCEARLSTTGYGPPSGIATRRDGGEPAERRIDAQLPAGRAVDLALECVDGEVILTLDGREAARLSQDRRIEDAGDQGAGEQRLAISAEGAAVTVEDVRIDRDLWYLEESRADVEVPEDGYYMLGDNTGSSSDSRKWQRQGLRLRDGTEIWWDGSPSTSSDHPTTWRPGDRGRPPASLLGRGTIRRVTDVEGIERWWLEEDEDDEHRPPVTETPFVTRDLVVGRAFFVFWPLLPGFPGRMKFIH